jgi:hypothetical protein
MPIVPGTPETESNNDFTRVSPVERASDGPSQIDRFQADYSKVDVLVDQSDSFTAQRDASQIAVSVNDGFAQAPEQAAKMLRLEMETGLPTNYIKDNLAEVERESAIRGFDIDAYQKKSPKFAKWLTENPSHFALVKDDLENIDQLQKQIDDYGMMDSLRDSVASGTLSLFGRTAKVPAYLYDAGVAFLNMSAGTQGPAGSIERAPESWYNNPVAKFFDDEAKVFHDRNSIVNKSVTEQIMNKDWEGAAKTALSQVAESAPTTLSLMVANLLGAGTPALIAAGATQAADVASRPENQKADLGTSMIDATASGSIEAIAERLGTFGIMKSWEKALAQNIGKQGAKEFMKNFSKQLAASFIGEGFEEGVTSLGQDAADAMTVNPDAMEGAGTRALDAFAVGAISGGVITSTGGAVAARINNQQMKAAAQLQKDFYTSLGDTVEASKVRARLPGKFKELAERMTAEGPVQDVYVDSEAFTEFFQSKPGGVAQAIQDLQIDKEFNATEESGGFIKVPLARWVDKMGGTDAYRAMADHVTFDPKKETVAGSNALLEAAREQAKASTEGGDTSAEALRTIEKEAFERMSKARDPGAKKKAKIYAAAMVRLATDNGIDPIAFEKEHGFDIARSLMQTDSNEVSREGEVVAAQTLYQGKAKANKVSSKEFKGWFRESKVTDQKGKPLVVYHGTARDFKEFKTRASADGFYFTNNESLANDYAKDAEANAYSGDELAKVLPVYLSFQNPMIVDDSIEGKFAAGYGHDELIKEAKKNGHDGLIIKNTRDNIIEGSNSDLSDTYIAFNPEQIKSVDNRGTFERLSPNIYNQGKAAENRGRIKLFSKGRSVIEVFNGADFSTSLHEMGHGFFHILERISNSESGSERTKKIFTDLLSFVGTDIDTWSKLSDEQREPYHEKLARGFEKYCFEGKAPAAHLQTAFDAFKAWVITVYKSLVELNVNLTDEARSAFDRLLATDEQIERARQEQRAEPLILDPKSIGMTDAQAERYAKIVEAAKIAAREDLLSQTMQQIIKERTKEWKAEEADVRKSVTAEVEAQRDQMLIQAFREGTLPGTDQIVKLDRASVEAAFGKERVDALPKFLFAKNGLDHNSLAEILGFDSGHSMLRMIEGTINQKELIEQLVREEMEVRHGDGDVFLNGGIYEAALEAIHNDDNAERLHLEQQALVKAASRKSTSLTRKIASRVPSIAETREKARKVIGEMGIREIKPYQFMRAERKYANEAAKLYVKGDIAGALEAKKKEALNHELYRQARNAIEQIDKFEGKFNKFFQEDERLAKNREINLVYAGRSILAGFGFGDSETTPEEHLKFLADYNPEGYAFIKEKVDAALENADYFENLTLNKFEDLHDLIDGIWDLSKQEKLIEIDGKKVLFDDAVATILAGVEKLPSEKKADKYTRTRTLNDDNLNYLATMKARATRMSFAVDSMDAHAGDVFKKHFYNEVRQATETYREKKGEAFKKLRDLFKTHKDRLGGGEIVAESIGHVFKDKNALLGALIHTGNQSNFERLILGRGWGTVDEDGNLDASKWDRFIQECHNNGTLTKADYDLVQGIWDINESMKADTQKAFKAMNGFYFAEIKAKEVVTPFGTYRGGYVPATPDNHESIDADIRDTKAKVEGGFMAELPKKNDSFTKSRLQNYSTPLLMDLGLITAHLDSVLKFTYITPKVKDTMKLIMNRKVVTALKQYDPAFLKHVVEPFLIRATTQSTTASTNNKGMDQFLTFMRNNQAVQLMFFNLPNTIQQVANFIPAHLRVGASHLLNGVKNSISNHKELAQNVAEKSTFMRNQLDRSAEKAIRETEGLIKNRTKFEQGGKWIEQNAYLSQIHLQNIMNLAVWSASYDQAIANGMGERESIMRADEDVRQTQSSMAPEDAAALEVQNPFVKSLMMFYGFFNNMGNLYTSEWAKAGALDQKAKAKKRAAIVGNYVVFALVGKLVIDSLDGQLGEDDDDKESLAFWLKYTFGSAFDLTTPMFGIPGQFAQVAKKNLFHEAQYGNRVSVSPMFSNADQILNNLTKARSQNGKDSTEIKSAMTLVAYAPLISFFPMPKPIAPLVGQLRSAGGYSATLGTLKRSVGYLADVNQGKVKSPKNPAEAAAGLITGRGQAR